jgi:tRNA threonylcarbamoyladenosine biosynthesis protein TsaE
MLVAVMLHVRTRSLAQTHAVAAAVAELSRAGDMIVLAGEMGAGKTAFAQGFGAALGVTEPITSPTFNLVHSYPAGRITLHHADVYRLATQHEVADLALAELAEDKGIVLVEWGDVVANVLGGHLAIRLETVVEDAQPAAAAPGSRSGDVTDAASDDVTGAGPVALDDDPMSDDLADDDPAVDNVDDDPVDDDNVDDDPVDDDPGVDPDEMLDEPRDITIAGVGRGWATRWASLEAALREVAASC